MGFFFCVFFLLTMLKFISSKYIIHAEGFHVQDEKNVL